MTDKELDEYVGKFVMVTFCDGSSITAYLEKYDAEVYKGYPTTYAVRINNNDLMLFNLDQVAEVIAWEEEEER